MSKDKAKLIYQYLNNKYKEFNHFQNVERICEFVNNNQIALAAFYNALYETASQKPIITNIEDYENSFGYYIDQFKIGGYPLFKDRLISYEECSKELEEKLLDNIAFTTREMLCNYLNIPTNIGVEFDTNQCCGIATYFTDKIVREMNNIKSTKIIVGDLLGATSRPHAFSLINIKDTNYIMDTTYSQFLSLYYMSLNCMVFPNFINAEPGFFMMIDKEKTLLLKHLLEQGWFKATAKNLKIYFDSFILSDRDAYYYLKRDDSMTTTKFSIQEYLDLIKGNKHNLSFDCNCREDSDANRLNIEQHKIIIKQINQYKPLK